MSALTWVAMAKTLEALGFSERALHHGGGGFVNALAHGGGEIP